MATKTYSFLLGGTILLLLNFLPNFDGYFEDCDRNISITQNDSFTIFSPNYFHEHPLRNSCRYTVSTLSDYEIFIKCSVIIYAVPASNSDIFLISDEGDRSFDNSERVLTSTVVIRASLFESVTMGYISPNGFMFFKCSVRSRPKECDCGWSFNRRIVGGVEANVNEFPFMAGIVRTTYAMVMCGGSIISHQFVLTAAHCFPASNNIFEYVIVVGEHDTTTGSESPYTQLFAIAKVIRHTAYQPNAYINDIALAQTKGSMVWSEGVGPVCLPFSNPSNNFAYEQIELAGWGTTSFGGPVSSVLMKTSAHILPDNRCEPYTRVNFSAGILCTYGESVDACQMDSGGPVIQIRQRMFLVGIIVGGFQCPSVGLNTRVTSFISWIVNNTNENFCRKVIPVA